MLKKRLIYLNTYRNMEISRTYSANKKNLNKLNLNKNNAEKHTSPDNTENTIFVGNIPNKTKIKEIKKMFRKFGRIVNARLRCAIRKELKIPKKLAVIKQEFHDESNHINAFIKFESFESCKTALKMNGQLLEGHHLRVTLASDNKANPKRSIFLGNLPFKVTDDDLWQTFEDCGLIDSVRVIRDEKTGIGKGFGYINFKSSDSVELALKLNEITILDRNVRVSRIVNNEKQRTLKKKTSLKIVQEPQPSNKSISNPEAGKKRKQWPKVKGKNEFQGQKTKPVIKKVKKKKNFDKRKIAIKQIAEKLNKKQ